MKNHDFLKYVQNINIDVDCVSEIEVKYGVSIPEYIGRIITCTKTPVFIDKNWRLMSFSELLFAQEQLHVDFNSKKILPLFDLGDNDFIVFHFNDNFWSIFNIVDQCSFKKRARLEDYFG